MKPFSVFDKTDINALAIGKFDGMHVAHQALFSRLGKKGGILVINAGHDNLTPWGERENYTDFPIFSYHLDSVRHLDGPGFIAKLLDEFPSLRKVVVGYDFRFGHNRGYYAEDLLALFPHEVVIVEEVKVDEITVHSGTIRELIHRGDLHMANKLLCHPYRVNGIKVPGQGIGRKQLYATINLFVENYTLPAEGVYATRTDIEGTKYHSVTFIGHRLSTDRNFSIETHILNGIPPETDKAGICFYKKLRDNHKYDKLEDLKAQITKDIADAGEILRSVDDMTYMNYCTPNFNYAI